MQIINLSGKLQVHPSFLSPNYYLAEGKERSELIQKVFSLYWGSVHKALTTPSAYVNKGNGMWVLDYALPSNVAKLIAEYLKDEPIQRKVPDILILAESILREKKDARALYSEEINLIVLGFPDDIIHSSDALADFVSKSKSSIVGNPISLSISHEFTHYLDYCRWPVEYKMAHQKDAEIVANTIKDAEKISKRYYNNPSEVHAITQEIIRLLKEKPSFSKTAIKQALPDIIDSLSATPYLDAGNKRKITKEVYKYFDANGLEDFVQECIRKNKKQEELMKILKEISGPRDLDNMVRDIFDAFLKQMPETYEKELFIYLFEKGEPGYVQSMREMARDPKNTGDVFQKTVESHIDDKFGEDDMPSIAMQDRYSNVDWNKMKKYWTMLQQKLTGALDAGIEKASNVVTQGV